MSERTLSQRCWTRANTAYWHGAAIVGVLWGSGRITWVQVIAIAAFGFVANLVALAYRMFVRGEDQ